MLTGEINEKRFLSVREAFDLVGRRAFGAEWNSECWRDRDSRQRKVSIKNLTLALQSDEVKANWHRIDGVVRPLTSLETTGEFNHFDLERDGFVLVAYSEHAVRCDIDKASLELYLSAHRPKFATTKMSDLANCRTWLLGELKCLDHPTKEALRREAKEKYKNLSGRGFLTAWDSAVAELPPERRPKAGAPKRKIPATI